jgi:hypothetical protein
MHTTQRIVIMLGAASLAVACAGAPKPTSQFADTQAALRAAHEVGADRVPEAQLHTTLAQEQLKRADKLMSDGDNAEAARVLARAKADAELAVSLSRRAEAQQALQSAKSAAPQVGNQVSMQGNAR